MAQQDNIGSYVRENKEIIKEYLETRYEIIRLKGIRSISKIAGSIAWILISMMLGLLLFIFGGLALGFWLSVVFDSHAMGFGITTLVILLVIVLLALLRKQLFINPVIRKIIDKAAEED